MTTFFSLIQYILLSDFFHMLKYSCENLVATIKCRLRAFVCFVVQEMR